MREWIGLSLVTALSLTGLAQESLPPLKDGKVPQTFEELWTGYDPRSEPLETEVLKEWEEDGVVLRVVRYRIGVFKGEKAMMAAVFGYTYKSESGKQLGWQLLGFLMPTDKAGRDRSEYVDLAAMIGSPGTKGMLALKYGASE